jgi:hypothetical protein
MNPPQPPRAMATRRMRKITESLVGRGFRGRCVPMPCIGKSQQKHRKNQSLCENSRFFVGRGFSRDIKPTR